MKEDFYDQVDRFYSVYPSYDAKILLGDYNAKLGGESVNSVREDKHNLHEVSTDNGRRFISLILVFIKPLEFRPIRMRRTKWIIFMLVLEMRLML